MIVWILLVFVIISPFSSLILLIWVFSHLCFVMLAKGLSILLIFSKNQPFVSLIFCIVFLVSISLISALIFIIYLQLLVLSLVCSCFSRSLRYIRSLLIWQVSFFNVDLIGTNFPLSTAFAVSYRFWKVVFSFSLNSRKILVSSLISLVTHWSSNSV
jgi:hypothetical protein